VLFTTRTARPDTEDPFWGISRRTSSVLHWPAAITAGVDVVSDIVSNAASAASFIFCVFMV
jgi:hypothetical protein